VPKEHNTWLMHYKATRLETFSPCQLHLNYHLSIQTLTTINLEDNNIGDEGAQHLAHGLHGNVVRDVLSLSITY
jgi:hypothetical protein